MAGPPLAVLGAQRGIGQDKVSLEEQVFASQALLFKCRRRQAPFTSEDVECLLRLALTFTGRGLRPVLTQASRLWGGGDDGCYGNEGCRRETFMASARGDNWSSILLDVGLLRR